MKKIMAATSGDMNSAPTEFQLMPAGRIDIHGDAPAFLDEDAATRIIATFAARGNDMVIDYEHQSLTDGQSPAAGWIKKLAWKGKEGLWAVVEWTKKAKEYLDNREYRYFSPVMWISEGDRRVVTLVNVALTNNPAINNLKPIVAKFTAVIEKQEQKEEVMIEKLKNVLGLAADAAEGKILEGVTLLVNTAKSAAAALTKAQDDLSDVVACKEVLEVLGAKEGDKKDAVVLLVNSLRAPADAAKTLSLEVAALKMKIAEMDQADLVQLALKDGKTSPDELDKWGRDLALKAPEQFKKIVLSRPVGSVVPVEGLLVAKDKAAGALDDTQSAVNRMMGVDDETFKKYNK